jgi:hypothetical protein
MSGLYRQRPLLGVSRASASGGRGMLHHSNATCCIRAVCQPRWRELSKLLRGTRTECVHLQLEVSHVNEILHNTTTSSMRLCCITHASDDLSEESKHLKVGRIFMLVGYSWYARLWMY